MTHQSQQKLAGLIFTIGQLLTLAMGFKLVTDPYRIQLAAFGAAACILIVGNLPRIFGDLPAEKTVAASPAPVAVLVEAMPASPARPTNKTPRQP